MSHATSLVIGAGSFGREVHARPTFMLGWTGQRNREYAIGRAEQGVVYRV